MYYTKVNLRSSIQALIISVFFFVETPVKFRNLANLLTLIQTEFFQYLLKICMYPCDILSLKNNSGVGSSSFKVNKKKSHWHMHFYFLNWKYFFDKKPNKNKSKEFHCRCSLLNFSFLFVFRFSLFTMSFLYVLLCKEFFLFFRWLASFWWFFFSFLRRTLYNTWKRHYRQLQVLIMIFNKKALVYISSISNLKNTPWNLLSFVSGIVSSECLKKIVQNYFSFALISNIF